MQNSFFQAPRTASLFLFLPLACGHMHALAVRSWRVTEIVVVQFSDRKNDLFNILWVLVFGFATLNILSLVTRRFEPNRNRFSFGETLAIMVVVVSVGLLSWELLTLFKIFPIHLQRH